MNTEHRNGNGPEVAGEPEVEAQGNRRDAQQASHAAPFADDGARPRADTAASASETDQAAADADQTWSDADQTSSDADQTVSGTDQAIADRDQLASDHDQERADRDHDARTDLTEIEERAYEAAHQERDTASVERLVNRFTRGRAMRERDATAGDRDRTAAARDERSRARHESTRVPVDWSGSGDAPAADESAPTTESEASLIKQLDELATRAAADRARAAADRERAAKDRAEAARERARLEAELRSAHLDELTGAYRREMGQLALSHEIDRARRSDGRFVVAFVDVDRLKDVNDHDGHAAGDRVLQTVVRAIRTRLRSFDPIIRYGGDEFVCGLGGTDVAEAERRFESIEVAIESETSVGISVGLAVLAEGDTAQQLTERADAAMLEVKAAHHSRE
jgi:diguanylate cyclase (GGDEF)-like protein